MELTWPIKLRIAAVAAVGIAVIGIYAWPMVAPADQFGVVSVINGTISSYDVLVLLGLAFGVGLVAYFLSWPYGSKIGILAVPAGMAIWAVRCGNMGTLLQLNTSIVSRQQIYSTFCWEPLLWLSIVAAGYLGVLLASQIIYPAESDTISQPRPKPTDGPRPPDIFIRLFGVFLGPVIREKFVERQKRLAIREAGKPQKRGFGVLLNVVIAVIGSAVVAQFFIGMLARDFTIWDSTSGAAVAQPAIGQIVFAVLVSFGLVGFLVQRVLGVDYIWPVIGSCLVNFVAVSGYGKYEVLEYFIQRWPAVFFSNSVLAVLPVQIVAFGSLGAIAGYWMAVRYDYWHRHEIKGE